MEKYFKPVHSHSGPNKSKLQNHHNQQHLHHQAPRSDRYISCDYTNRDTDESYGHRYDQPGHYDHNICSDVHLCHQTTYFTQCENDDTVQDHTGARVTLSRASSSSSITSSSSSTSSTSWYTEGSATDISHRHAERPQHSLSCSNIHDVRRFYPLDENSDPVVFATIKHGSNGSICSEVRRASEKGKQVFAPLDRGHSQSNEGFLQGNERKIAKSHLNRSLCFSEEDIMLRGTKGPKRAVSSSQLPSKGILKNREPHSDIRKAKSMEVLSPRVAKEVAKQSLSRQKAKGPAQIDIEQGRGNFVQEKLKFSAFLDEITKQVISPSDLKILGLNTNKTAGLAPLSETLDPPNPQLPPKKQRESSVQRNEQKHQNKHVKAAPSSTQKLSDLAKSDRHSSYVAMNHHGSPPPHNTHHKSTHKDRRPPSTDTSGYGRSASHLTDGTSTSPEFIQPRQRHKPQPVLRSPLSHVLHRRAANSLPSSSHSSGAGLGSESSSSKSEAYRTRETGTSSEQSAHYHAQHTILSEQQTGTQFEADHLQALQEENADLHQHLLQTMVFIKNLEAELQRTRDELIHVKEKYKSLLESHKGTQQSNHLLQDHLHAGADSLNSERQYMLTRLSQLTSELTDAHRTIKALENINVPNLIKESLENHFFTSAGAKEQFISGATQFSQVTFSPQTENQLYTPKVDCMTSHDWLSKLKEGGQQRPTAFTPFKHGLSTTENQSFFPGSSSPCSPSFSAADICASFHKKCMSGFAIGPQPICVQPRQTTTDKLLPNVQQTPMGGGNCAGKGEGKMVLSEPDVTAMSAQQILNDFMQQLRAQKEPDRDTMQQDEWGEWPTRQTENVAE